MSTSTITVVGMTCAHCVKAVTEEVSAIQGVTHVGVDLDSGKVTIESDAPLEAAALEAAALEAAVDEAGYSIAS